MHGGILTLLVAGEVGEGHHLGGVATTATEGAAEGSHGQDDGGELSDSDGRDVLAGALSSRLDLYHS